MSTHFQTLDLLELHYVVLAITFQPYNKKIKTHSSVPLMIFIFEKEVQKKGCFYM